MPTLTAHYRISACIGYTTLSLFLYFLFIWSLLSVKFLSYTCLFTFFENIIIAMIIGLYIIAHDALKQRMASKHLDVLFVLFMQQRNGQNICGSILAYELSNNQSLRKAMYEKYWRFTGGARTPYESHKHLDFRNLNSFQNIIAVRSVSEIFVSCTEAIVC